MRQHFDSVDEYIQTFPEETQKILDKIRKIILDTVPGLTELISYQMPAYKLGKRYIIYFAGYKKHIGLYPMTSEVDKKFKKELEPYYSGKATLRFPLDQPIPYGLIKKIVVFKAKRSAR